MQLTMNSNFSGEFDITIIPAEDFLAGKKIPKKNMMESNVDKKNCKVQ